MQDPLLRTVEELAGIGTWRWIPAPDRVLASVAAERILHVSNPPEGVSFKAFWSSLESADADTLHQLTQSCLRSGGAFTVSVRVSHGPIPSHHLRVRGMASGNEVLGVLSDVSREAEIENELELLRSISEGTTDAIFMKDVHGRYRYINESGAKFLGTSPQEIVGRTDEKFFSPESAAKLRAIDTGIMESGKTSHHEETLDAADATRTYLVTKAPYRDHAGRVRGLIGVSRDISERKLTEDRLRLQSHVLDSMLEGVMVADDMGKIEYTNPAYERTFGYRKGELLGRPVSVLNDLPQSASGDLVGAILTNLRARGSWTGELQNRRKDGSTFLTRAQIMEISLKGRRHWVSMQEDITERRQIEKLLEFRTRELARSNSELEQFAYAASHDLREPLRVVRSFVALLVKKLPEALDETSLRYVKFITDAVDRMDLLITGLLEYSRVGRMEMSMSEFDLNEVLEHVKDNLSEVIQESHAEIESDSSPRIWGSAPLIERVLQNLIHNSIKYRSAEPPRIRIYVIQERGFWKISVTDNGVGIDPKYRERIFELFQKLQPARLSTGSGLGLSICKRIVGRLGGQIWLESQLGKGSTFTFTLPAEGANHVESHQDLAG